MNSGIALLRIAPPVVFVLLVHTAALLNLPALGVAALVVFCFLNLLVHYLTGASGKRLALWALLGVAMTLLLLAALQGATDLAMIILLPPVLLNGLFLFAFGRTLLPGREALITRFSRLEWQTMTPELNLYTRRLTFAWAVLFALGLAASILFAVYADLATWSWFVNLGVPAVFLAFFLLEHPYRIIRFGSSVTVSPVRTIKVMLRPDAWVAGS